MSKTTPKPNTKAAAAAQKTAKMTVLVGGRTDLPSKGIVQRSSEIYETVLNGSASQELIDKAASEQIRHAKASSKSEMADRASERTRVDVRAENANKRDEALLEMEIRERTVQLEIAERDAASRIKIEEMKTASRIEIDTRASLSQKADADQERLERSVLLIARGLLAAVSFHLLVYLALNFPKSFPVYGSVDFWGAVILVGVRGCMIFFFGSVVFTLIHPRGIFKFDKQLIALAKPLVKEGCATLRHYIGRQQKAR